MLRDNAFDLDALVLEDLPFGAYYPVEDDVVTWLTEGPYRRPLRAAQHIRSSAHAGVLAGAEAVGHARLAPRRAQPAGMPQAVEATAQATSEMQPTSVQYRGPARERLWVSVQASTHHMDYLRDVVEPDDAEVLDAVATMVAEGLL